MKTSPRPWPRATAERPCAVCGGADRCATSPRGRHLVCHRVAGGAVRPLQGGGYLHLAPAAEPPPDDSPDNPHRLADDFLASLAPPGSPHRLRFWRGEFYRWGGAAYGPLRDSELQAQVAEFARGEFVRIWRAEAAAHAEAGDEKRKPPRTRPVRSPLVNNVVLALRGRCAAPDAEAPAWLDGAAGPDPAAALPAANGLVDLEAAAAGRPALLPPTPLLFTFASVDYGYDPGAPPPAHWHRFIGELWPDDPDSAALLQEWCGLCLTADTSHQKMLMLVGPRRAGKGTIFNTVADLVGRRNVVSPTLGSLATDFGLAPLIGKRLASVPDARLGGRADGQAIVERLLSITGEDRQSVNRKYRDAWDGRLSARFMLASNELPRLADASGALAGRMLVLRLTRSFYGREDRELGARLAAELPGILNWSIEGLARLRARGRFVQPASGEELVREMEDIASPVGAFLRDRCRVGPGESAAVDALYRAWRQWCDDQGRREPGTTQEFGRHLRAAVPDLRDRRPKVSGERWREYVGVSVRPFLTDAGSAGSASPAGVANMPRPSPSSARLTDDGVAYSADDRPHAARGWP